METVKKNIRSSGGHKNPSYVVSIPISWCQNLGLEKGSSVYLTLDSDKIVLSKDLVSSQDKKEEISLAQKLESHFE